MREPIFVINAGSSSIKFSLYQTPSDRSVEAGAHGQVEGIRTSPRLKVADVQGRVLADQVVAGKD
jgi:acetate kinase